MMNRVSTRLSKIYPFISSIELMQHPRAGCCLSIGLSNEGPETNVRVPPTRLVQRPLSASSYNSTTNQRKSKLLNILQEARISNRSAVAYDAKKPSIDWADGHKSVFDLDLLVHMLVKPRQCNQLNRLWNGSTLGQLPLLKKSSFSFREFSQNFVKFGIVAVEEIEPTIEATGEFAHAIAPFHETIYETMWTISNFDQEEAHAGVEYSNDEVPLHTDFVFYLQPPGVMVTDRAFQCPRPAEEGGETVVVDAFAAAERLKRENPAAFRLLCEMRIGHDYIENGVNPQFACAPSKPVIELSEEGDYVQIRFNPSLRAPLRLSLDEQNGMSAPEDVLAFYETYQGLFRICHDPAMALKIRLTPGTVIFIDNFRLLHARTAFSGYRKLVGCYLSRDVLMAKARLHVDDSYRI